MQGKDPRRQKYLLDHPSRTPWPPAFCGECGRGAPPGAGNSIQHSCRGQPHLQASHVLQQSWGGGKGGQEATLRAILSPEPPLGSLSLIRPAGGSAFFAAQSCSGLSQPQHMTPDTHLAPQTPSLCLPLENPAHNKDFLCYQIKHSLVWTTFYSSVL